MWRFILNYPGEAACLAALAVAAIYGLCAVGNWLLAEFFNH